MSKHTPGPWHLDKGTLGFPTVSSAHYEVATPSFCGTNYGQLRKSPEKAEEILANARLIAAAPELLEALKDFLSACDAAGKDDDLSIVDTITAEMEDKARAAIAKAEGR